MNNVSNYHLLLRNNHLRSIKTDGCPLASHTVWCSSGPFGYSFTTRGNCPHTYLMSAPCTFYLLIPCGGWKSGRIRPWENPPPLSLWPSSEGCLTLLCTWAPGVKGDAGWERAWLPKVWGNQTRLIFLPILLHVGEFIDPWPSLGDRSVPLHLPYKRSQIKPFAWLYSPPLMYGWVFAGKSLVQNTEYY